MLSAVIDEDLQQLQHDGGDDEENERLNKILNRIRHK